MITDKDYYHQEDDDWEPTMSEGRVTISRFTSNKEPFAGVTIEIIEDATRTRTRITLSLEDVAYVITGQAQVSGKIEVLQRDQ